MMNLGFEYYKTFCAVAESKSITDASKKLLLSQPAISKSIKQLEQELNIPLFNRQHNGIVLTPNGEFLYKYIKPIILQFDNTKNMLDTKMENEKVNIRIGASMTVLRLYLVNYIKQFLQKYPYINIYIEENTNSNLITKLNEGAIDLAIIISDANYNKSHQFINRRPLKDIHYGLFANKNYFTADKRPISIGDLKNKNFVINANSTRLNKYLKNYDLTAQIKVNSNAFIIDFINAQMGIGLTIKEFMKSFKNINEIKIIEDLPTAQIVALTPTHNFQNIAISKFLNEIESDF